MIRNRRQPKQAQSSFLECHSLYSYTGISINGHLYTTDTSKQRTDIFIPNTVRRKMTSSYSEKPPLQRPITLIPQVSVIVRYTEIRRGSIAYHMSSRLTTTVPVVQFDQHFHCKNTASRSSLVFSLKVEREVKRRLPKRT